MPEHPLTRSPTAPRRGPSPGRTNGRRAGRSPIPAATVAILAAALVLSLARPALAWGRLGHRASAMLTESLLSPRAKAIIGDLLEPGESLADAATWADENSRTIPGSAAWHYVNVPISAPRYDPRDCRPRGCVVSKIPEFRQILADRNAPRARRRQALRFFVHLVQDLHQPMHVADRDDLGGNRLQLRLGRYDNTNLHQVWDSGLLRRQYRHEVDLVHDLKELAFQRAARDWPRGRIEDWADESLELGRRAYRVPGSNASLRSGAVISRAYEEVNRPLAVKRLAQAGVRLAALLNEILGTEPGR